MLEEYFLLVRRIPGLSLSIDDYWKMDTFTTQKLLDMENAIIKIEKDEYDELNGKHTYNERPDENSESMNDIMDMMGEEYD